MSSWRENLTAWFPFGKAPLMILAIAVISSIWVFSHRQTGQKADLTLWTFATSHYLAYKEARPAFETEHGIKVDLQLASSDAVNSRLRAAFWAGLKLPDLVEVEITRAGGNFQGNEDSIPFIDLTPFLKEDGLLDRIVKSRFSAFSSRGHIYGMPHDVHPVMLAYRKDLFEQAGIDASKIETWDDFIREGRRITRTSDVDPSNPQYMMEMSRTARTPLDTFMLQRGGGYFDAEGNLTMDNEIAVQNLIWYVPLVAGPRRIGQQYEWGQPFVKAVMGGRVWCFLCPDWRSKFVEQDMPESRGKLALMPLPAFKPGGRRTSTWGGTMIGITKTCKDPGKAWALAKHLYLNEKDLERRFLDTNILPPVRDVWDRDAFKAPREFWGGQRVGQMYVELADDTPAQYANPYLELATDKLAEALSTCVTKYEQLCVDGLTPEEEKEFEAFARKRLRDNADAVRRQMKRSPF